MNRVCKNAVLIVTLAISMLLPLAAAVHTSVPLGHRVYSVLDVAEIRNLIDRQIGARPFGADRVINLLLEIQDQPAKLSSAEREEVASLLAELNFSHGYEDSPFSDVFSTGLFRTYNPEKNLGASMGINLATSQTVSLVSKEYDSRNSLLAFLKGDLGEHISFNMNFGLNLDRLNNNVFLPTDFTIPSEGFYMQLSAKGSQLREIPFKAFYTGLALSPEIAATFFDGDLQLRWGSVKRDWGSGKNNLMVSGSARAFEGIELSLNITDWLRYSVITGSLGKFSLDRLGDNKFFSDDFQVDKPYYRFDNNLSAHRVEVDATPNLTLAIFESVLWGKRFEIGYLNPLAIYMFEQNNLGDIDNMLAGLDFNYTLGGKIRFYGSVATTELNKIGSFKTMLTYPRNVLAFQAGITTPLPIGSFSSLTFQWTYLAPFFYSHYPLKEQVGTLDATGGKTFTSKRGNTYTHVDVGKIIVKYRNGKAEETYTTSTGDSWISSDGRIEIKKQDDGHFLIWETYNETAYVNKGEALGYPLNPNSQEFLLQLDLGFEQGWTTQAKILYQVRSGQYGYTIEQFLPYGSEESFAVKDFWGHTFEHALTFDVQVTKKFASMPFELNAGYRFTTLWERDIEGSVSSSGRHNDEFSLWKNPSFDHVLRVGARLYF